MGTVTGSLKASAGHATQRSSLPVAEEPVRNTGRTGIVGGGGQSKIAETLLEVGEKFGGFWYCFFDFYLAARSRLLSRK
jgi:hypothetical protein